MALTIEMLPAREGDALLISVEGREDCTILIDGARGYGQGVAYAFDRAGHHHWPVDRDACPSRSHRRNSEAPRRARATSGRQGDLVQWLPPFARSGQSCGQACGSPHGQRAGGDHRPCRHSWNVVAAGGAIQGSEDAPQTCEIGPVRLTVLGPPLKALERLQPQWLEECYTAGILPGQDAANDPPAAVMAFAGEVPEPFDLDALLAVGFDDDRALANASSISVLLEYDGVAVLLPGDSPAGLLQQALTELRQRRLTDHLGALPPIRALKMPHHGSGANVSLDLLAWPHAADDDPDFLAEELSVVIMALQSRCQGRGLHRGVRHDLPICHTFGWRPFWWYAPARHLDRISHRGPAAHRSGADRGSVTRSALVVIGPAPMAGSHSPGPPRARR